MSAFETGTGAVGATGATGPAGVTGVTGAGVTGATGPEATDGWISDTAATWTRTADTTFTVTGDRTAVFSKGTRLKLTQTTVKYFVVVLSSHAAGTTTVTVTGGTDYTLAAAAITVNYYSYAANPQGYPGWFTFAPAAAGFSSTTTDSGRFSVNGRVVVIAVRIQGTSNAATFNFTLPMACGSAELTANFGAITRADNGLGNIGRYLFTTSTNVRLDKDPAVGADGWTASGTKSASLVTNYEF